MMLTRVEIVQFLRAPFELDGADDDFVGRSVDLVGLVVFVVMRL